jgi:hypothetical protein
MKRINIFMGMLLLGAIAGSCSKNDSAAPTPYNVSMTDAPGPYSAVYIDLQSVEVTGADGNAVVLNVKKGIYNLLNFSNGIDTLIATGSLNVASVEQVRLILGTNNSIVLNSVTYPLSTPSAEQSGLKLQVHQTLQAGVLYSVLLDFDANQSIVVVGNGTYKLKPVIRTVETPISGSIRGHITPAGTLALVTAISNTTGLSYSTNVSITGDFMLVGVPAGTYTVTVTPVSPFLPVTVGNIAVATGITANMGTLIF